MKFKYEGNLPVHIPLLNLSVSKDDIIEENNIQKIKKIRSTRLFSELKEKKITKKEDIKEEVIYDNPAGI
jgi:hypothetical protein